MSDVSDRAVEPPAGLAAARVSVVLPVYNGGAYVAEAIESILTQTYRDFVLYLLNDGSTDSSLDVLQSYAKKDTRVRVVSRENRGLIATLNEGIALAETEYLARMDGDDVAMPDRFEKQIAYLDAHPECVAVGSDVLLIDSDGAPLYVMEYPHTHAEIEGAQRTALNVSVMAHPTAMVRMSAIEGIGGYHREFIDAEDIDFFLRLGEAGELANVPEVLLKYRQHLQSIGYAKRQQQWESALAAAEAAIARRKDSSYGLDETFFTQTTYDMMHKWVWWAIRGGHFGTARKHALRLLGREPLRLRSWRAMYCAWRGR